MMLGVHGWPWCTTTVDFSQGFVPELQRTNGSDYVNLAGLSPGCWATSGKTIEATPEPRPLGPNTRLPRNRRSEGLQETPQFGSLRSPVSSEPHHHFLTGVGAVAGAAFEVVLEAFLCFFTCFLAAGALGADEVAGALLVGA